ncbi:uncharacterized protein [Argopecten irradians]|uniref:uncharacterized protein n=1 Tax=Argopecten irradians TaxID=31199 RepID=UPI0037122F84
MFIYRESNSKRDVPQVKKLFDNVKQQVKKYLDARKRPVTGGGEGPAPPTTSQQLLLDHWKGRPGMEGIGSGLDTSNPDLSEVVETSVALSTVLELPEVSENFNTAISAMFDDSSCSTHQPTTHQPTKPVTKSSSGKRKRRSNSYEELEEAEKRRAESEARLYNMQRVWERRKLQAEIEAIKSKTAAEVAYWKKRTALLTAENEN